MQIVDIESYEGIYQIDEMGNAYSLRYGKVRKLKPGLSGDGYLTVCLWKDRSQKTFKVHRLVAKAFLSDYSKDLQVDHIDMVKTNNKLSNLRMATNQQNSYNTDAKGYSWHKNANKWCAQIMKDGKNINLGYFDKEEDAREAYLAAKKIYHIF